MYELNSHIPIYTRQVSIMKTNVYSYMFLFIHVQQIAKKALAKVYAYFVDP